MSPSMPTTPSHPPLPPQPPRAKTRMGVVALIVTVVVLGWAGLLLGAAAVLHLPTATRVGTHVGVALHGAALSEVILASGATADGRPGTPLARELVDESPAYCFVLVSARVTSLVVSLSRVGDARGIVHQQLDLPGGDDQFFQVHLAHAAPGRYRCAFQANGETREAEFVVAPLQQLSAVVATVGTDEDGQPLAPIEGPVAIGPRLACAAIVDRPVRAFRFELLREGDGRPEVDRVENLPPRDGAFWVSEALRLGRPGLYTCRFTADGIVRSARFQATAPSPVSQR